jgi:uncharacterized Tic20 family protein
MSTDQPTAAPYIPSQDERALACITHLTVFVSSIGFLVAVGLWIYLHTGRKYPFAAFQAGQAVLFQFIVMILTFMVIGFAMLIMFGIVGMGMAAGGTGAGEAAFGVAVVIGIMIIMVMIAALTLAMYGYAIFAAVRSYQATPFRIPGISALAGIISPMPSNVQREPERDQP